METLVSVSVTHTHNIVVSGSLTMENKSPHVSVHLYMVHKESNTLLSDFFSFHSSLLHRFYKAQATNGICGVVILVSHI